MPAENTNVFVSDGQFSEGVPYYFVIYARLEGIAMGDEWVSNGKWGRVFSVVEGGGEEEVELVYSEWECLSGQGRKGYLVSFLFFPFSFCLIFDKFSLTFLLS